MEGKGQAVCGRARGTKADPIGSWVGIACKLGKGQWSSGSMHRLQSHVPSGHLREGGAWNMAWSDMAQVLRVSRSSRSEVVPCWEWSAVTGNLGVQGLFITGSNLTSCPWDGVRVPAWHMALVWPVIPVLCVTVWGRVWSVAVGGHLRGWPVHSASRVLGLLRCL